MRNGSQNRGQQQQYAAGHTRQHTQRHGAPAAAPARSLDGAVWVELDVLDAALHANLAAARCSGRVGREAGKEIKTERCEGWGAEKEGACRARVGQEANCACHSDNCSQQQQKQQPRHQKAPTTRPPAHL